MVRIFRSPFLFTLAWTADPDKRALAVFTELANHD